MKKILTLIPLLALASGCATFTRGATEAVLIETDPPGALVTLSTGETCHSPCSLEMKRKDGFLVIIEKGGYQTARIEVISKTANAGAAGMAGNVLVGGLVGVAVDANSGAMRDLHPNPLLVKLVPRGDVYESRPAESDHPQDID